MEQNLNNYSKSQFFPQPLYTIFVLVILASCSGNGTGDSKSPISKIGKVFSGSSFSSEDFAQQLKATLPKIDTAGNVGQKSKITTVNQALAYCYQSNAYAPVWVDDNKNAINAATLIAELDSLQWDGIDLQRYQLDILKKSKENALSESSTVADVIHFDTLCTRAYLQAARDLLLGVYIPKSIDTLWFHQNDSTWDAPSVLGAMSHTKQYPSLKAYRSQWVPYSLLQNANRHYTQLLQDQDLKKLTSTLQMNSNDSIVQIIIKKQMPWLTVVANDTVSDKVMMIKGFQYYWGQKVTGKVDSPTYNKLVMQPDAVLKIIRNNQERLRWMNQAPEKNYVIVDIPLMELYLNHDSAEGMHMRVVVGKPSRQTPALNANMANVVLNPPWGVPPTILKNDVAPGLSKHGAAYLAKKGLKAYNAKGDVVNAAHINRSNYRRYSFRQSPGDDNALGVVKFNLPNRWDIYLHDTPHKSDFPNRYRAKSSGCIRVEKPREMAEYILTKMEGREKFTRAHIDSVVTTHKTQYETLHSKIPVHIVYLTAFQDSLGNQLRFLDDIYKRDGNMAARTARISK